MQTINAVEYDIESPRDDPSAALRASALHRIRLAGIRDAIGEQQTVPSFEEIAYQWKSCLAKEVRLCSIGRKDMGEGV